MSSLKDPFDLIKTETDAENVVPFLARPRVEQMIETALSHQQLQREKKSAPFLAHKKWWSGGVGAAACVILLLALFPFQTPPVHLNAASTGTVNQALANDANEFSELVMLDTWDSY